MRVGAVTMSGAVGAPWAGDVTAAGAEPAPHTAAMAAAAAAAVIHPVTRRAWRVLPGIPSSLRRVRPEAGERDRSYRRESARVERITRAAGPAGSAHPFELSGDVRLERLAHGRHVVGVAEILADQPVQAVPGGVLLGRGRPGHDVGGQVHAGARHLTEVDLGDAGRVRDQHLHLALRLGAPESGLGGQRLADPALRVQPPGPAGVDQIRLADVAERQFLTELEALDRGVAAHAGALPPAEQERQRRQVGMGFAARVAGHRRVVFVHAGQGRRGRRDCPRTYTCAPGDSSGSPASPVPLSAPETMAGPEIVASPKPTASISPISSAGSGSSPSMNVTRARDPPGRTSRLTIFPGTAVTLVDVAVDSPSGSAGAGPDGAGPDRAGSGMSQDRADRPRARSVLDAGDVACPPELARYSHRAV